MDNNKLKKLNGYHVVFLVQNTMVGLGILSLPQKLSPMGYSQWWLPIAFGVLANLAIIPMIWLMSRYEKDNLFTLNEKLVGKFLGKLLNAALIIVLIVFLASIIEGYFELIQVVALPDRDILGPLLLFSIMLIYLVLGGIKTIARFCIMAFILTIWMTFFLEWPYRRGEISHLFPLFNFTLDEFIQAFPRGFYSMVGFELILIYFPYIVNQKKALMHASIGIWITAIVYLSITIASVMYFSEWQLTEILYPILSLLKSVEMSFFERIDVMGISLWVVLLISTSGTYLWVAKKGMDSLRANNKTYHVYLLITLVVSFVLIPFSKEFQDMLYDRIFYAKLAFVLWPNVLILLHLVKSKRKQAAA